MMPEVSLVGVLIVAAVAFVVPLALGLIPALRVPSVVIEIVAGIIIGPAVLGLVEVDEPLQFMALIGLAFLLLLAGMEIDLGGLLRGGALRSAGIGFALSLVIAFGIASLLGVSGLIQAPLLVAIMLSATSLGIVVPVLVTAIGITVAEVKHFGRLSMVLRKLQDSSAQIRVRGAFLFLIGSPSWPSSWGWRSSSGRLSLAPS
jgi:Kef-type K+ transport system membrane component KefB